MNRSKKHLLEIAEIEQMRDCPFGKTQPADPSNPLLQNGITWLRLQNYRLTFHLTYIDLLVVGAYILFIFSALQYTSTTSLVWLHQVTFAVLLAFCVLFIGVHLLAQRQVSIKQQLKLQEIECWQQYCCKIKRERRTLRRYALSLVAFSMIFCFNQFIGAPDLLIGLTFFGTLLFSYGLYFLVNTIRLKKQTECYLESASESSQFKVCNVVQVIT